MINWKASDEFAIRLGQFPVVYDNEALQPTWALQFVDRSILSRHLGFERDQGIDVHGLLASALLEYHLFAINGQGRNQTNLNTDILLGARVALHAIGSPSSTPYLGAGVSAIHERSRTTANGDRIARLTVDAEFRRGRSSILALANLASNLTQGVTDRGFLAQGGLYIAEDLQAVARFAYIKHRGALVAGTLNRSELTLGANYFLKAQAAKLQADYSLLSGKDGDSRRTDHRIRLQFQLFL